MIEVNLETNLNQVLTSEKEEKERKRGKDISKTEEREYILHVH
jgi:hypothetical protein